jgi:septal ring factor EnvC (AmiA/AmiB activator)
MDIGFFISLGTTVFSAGIVFGVLKTQVSHLKEEVADNQKAAQNALDRLERIALERHTLNKESYQDLKRRLEENDRATQNVAALLSAIQQELKHITQVMDEVKRRMERLEEKR